MEWKRLVANISPDVLFSVEVAGVKEEEPVVFYMADLRKVVSQLFHNWFNPVWKIQSHPVQR